MLRNANESDCVMQVDRANPLFGGNLDDLEWDTHGTGIHATSADGRQSKVGLESSHVS